MVEIRQTNPLVLVCVWFQADAPPEDPVHAVLGGPDPDVDAVAATLCLALHLSQVMQVLCVLEVVFTQCILSL